MVGVTVIIATCNRREMAAQALQSVLAQTYRNFELVIVDDGSTDGTPLHLMRLLGAEPRAIEILSRMNPTAISPFFHQLVRDGISITYQYHPNRGLGAARNRGIRHARGVYLAFLEAEDLWEPTHLATLIAFLETEGGARIARVGGRLAKDGARARRARRAEEPSGWIFAQALSACPAGLSCAVVHRGCFAECGTFDENMPACEDYDLWLRLAARFPVHFVPGPEVTLRSPRPEASQHSWAWDRFRVYALEKAFQSGQLNPEQRFRVSQEIVHRCEHLVEGYRRQKSEERANFYERKRKRFAQEVRKLRAAYGYAPTPEPARAAARKASLT